MEYKLEKVKFSELRNIIELPDYQRDYVWPRINQKNLIHSMLQGLPIGTITVYKDKDKYVIIDGLQRVNTMIKYSKKVSKLYEFKNIEENLNIKENFENKLDEKDAINLHKIVKKWYEEDANIDSIIKISVVMPLQKKFEKKQSKEYEFEFIYELIEEVLMAIIKFISINDYEIPLLVCDNEKEQLPIVFERMNTTTKRLTKYEVYAAGWYNIKFEKKQKSGDDLVGKLIDEYKKMRSSEVDGEIEYQNDNNTIRLHQIFLLYNCKYENLTKNLKILKVDSKVFTFEVYSLLKSKKVYNIDKYVNNRFLVEEDSNSAMDVSFLEEVVSDFDNILNIVKKLDDLLLDQKNNGIYPKEIIEEKNFKVKKFWVYYIIYSFLNEKGVEGSGVNLNNEAIKYEYWDDKRQTTDIENAIKNYELSKGERSKKTVKLRKISETYIKDNDNKLRIQVKPEAIIGDIRNGYYKELFGHYQPEDYYIRFNTIDLINSSAINRSLYIYINDINKFKNSKEDVLLINGGNAISIMNKKYFDKEYRIFKDMNTNNLKSSKIYFEGLKLSKEQIDNMLMAIYVEGKSTRNIDSEVFNKEKTNGWITKSLSDVFNVDLKQDKGKFSKDEYESFTNEQDYSYIYEEIENVLDINLE